MGPASEISPFDLVLGQRGCFAVLRCRAGWVTGARGRLFLGPQGGIPRRRHFNRAWHKAPLLLDAVLFTLPDRSGG